MSVKKNLNLAFQNNRDDRKGAIYSEVANLHTDSAITNSLYETRL